MKPNTSDSESKFRSFRLEPFHAPETRAVSVSVIPPPPSPARVDSERPWRRRRGAVLGEQLRSGTRASGRPAFSIPLASSETTHFSAHVDYFQAFEGLTVSSGNTL